MIIHHVPQRSSDWLALRAGKVTGSCAKDLLAKIKSGEAAARRDLRYKLVAEILSQSSQEDGYVNQAMQWGIDHEQEALTVYEALRGVIVDPIGFVAHDTLPVGTSPDGFVGEDGILSIKCPKTATHLGYLRAGGEPVEHVAQNTHELWLTGRAWIDFFSYDPRLPEGLQVFLCRVTRTPAQLDAYGTEILAFLGELDSELQAIRTMANLTATLQAAVA